MASDMPSSLEVELCSEPWLRDGVRTCARQDVYIHVYIDTVYIYETASKLLVWGEFIRC